jgi:Fe-S cluster assembly iron-binding protein IscA
MALDESKDDDTISEEGGIRFIMDAQTADILRQSGGLTIDYVDESYRKGYMLTLGNTGDCSSKGSCNGCG